MWTLAVTYCKLSAFEMLFYKAAEDLLLGTVAPSLPSNCLTENFTYDWDILPYWLEHLHIWQKWRFCDNGCIRFVCNYVKRLLWQCRGHNDTFQWRSGLFIFWFLTTCTTETPPLCCCNRVLLSHLFPLNWIPTHTKASCTVYRKKQSHLEWLTSQLVKLHRIKLINIILMRWMHI